MIFKRNIPTVDIKFAELVSWASKKLSLREKKLIYIFENFQNAYLTKREIESGKQPSKYYIDQMLKTEKYIDDLNVPIKI